MILPSVTAPCPCKDIRPQAGVQRNSLDEVCRASSPWLEHAFVVEMERAGRCLCMYTDRSSGFLQARSARRFVGMGFFVGAGPGVPVLLEPVRVRSQSMA